jgi:hypothetical protein
MGEVVVDLAVFEEEEGLIGLNWGELDEAMWRSIDAADSSSGVSASGVGGADEGACAVGALEVGAGGLLRGLDDMDEDVAMPIGVVAPGPRLRKGTCVEVYVRMGSKQCVEEGGEGRYDGELEARLEVEALSEQTPLTSLPPTVPTKVPNESGEGRICG